MPKILTRLRIDEVSAVDRGAGEGVKIVLMKRDDTGQGEPHAPSLFSRMMAEADADADEITKARSRDSGGGAHALAAALSTHLLDRLDDLRQKHGFTKAKESPMKDNLTSIMKDLGPIGVAKQIVAEGRTFGISESDFTSAAANHAAKQHPGLRPDAAFAKLYEAEEIVRRAVGVLKSAPLVADLTPLVVGGAAAQALDDPAEAIAQLKQLGAQRYPSASASAQFEKALTDPANHKLARIAVPIPRATTSFAFPSR
jgi:hypothetical protein